jgi:iron complex transport system permease protein
MRAERTKIKLSLFYILMLLVFFLFLADLFTGPVIIPFQDVLKIIFTGESVRSEWITIIKDFRMPRALTALLAGAALSVSGLQMQTVYRNPLAGPDVLGISAGASLGVALLVLGFSAFIPFDIFSVAGKWSLTAASWLGSGVILLLLLSVSMRVSDIRTILILGIMFSSAVYAIVSLLQFFSNESMLRSFVMWTMGSLGNITRSQLKVLLPCVLAGLLLSFLLSKVLNVMLLGENYSRSLGVNIALSRFLIFGSTSILTGSVTAFCGPLGFIGIAVPHISRVIFKTSEHKILIPGSILSGAAIMAVSDIISKCPGLENSLPINAVTALFGIPVVIWVIIKNQKIG